MAEDCTSERRIEVDELEVERVGTVGEEDGDDEADDEEEDEDDAEVVVIEGIEG